MTFDWIQELPSKDTPLTKKFFEKIANSILDVAFPIGKTEMFFDNEDHSNYMGFTWERTSEGCVPVGINASDSDFNEIGKTGGEKTHKLTSEEVPSHYHTVYVKDFLDSSNGATTLPYYGAINNNAVSYGYGNGVGNTKEVAMTNNQGSSNRHNNLQPYQVFAIWRRIA